MSTDPLARRGSVVYNGGMKEVDVLGTLLSKYSNGEMVHYIATELGLTVSALRKDSSPENLLKQMGAIQQAYAYLQAVDEKMNHTTKNTAVVA